MLGVGVGVGVSQSGQMISISMAFDKPLKYLLDEGNTLVVLFVLSRLVLFFGQSEALWW